MSEILSNNATIPKVSIIIPIWGAEKFLPACLDSILTQTYQDFEVIMVDDKSPDSCGKICDEYAAKDKRFEAIHQKNTGASRARWNGVLASKSEWITFIDDDDTLPPDALESLMSKAHDNTDHVIGFSTTIPSNPRAMTLEECREAIFSGGIPVTAWGKLYRKTTLTEDLFTNYGFPAPGDYLMTIKYLFSIHCNPEFVFKRVYNYRRVASSEAHTTVKTLDFEMKVDDIILNSIPKEKLPHYIKFLTHSRINGLGDMAFRQPEVLAKHEHPYIQRIEQGIKDYGYKLSLKERIILRSTSPKLIKFTVFCSMAKNSLKYRLSNLLH